MAKTIQVPERLKDILASSIISDEGFELPPVERKDYEAIKKATIALGVKWDRKRKLHVWDRPGAKEDFEAWVNGDSVKVTDIKQEWQQFDTPNDLAKRMADWLNVQKWHFVLEPSAGIGRILDKLPEAGHKVAIEIDPNRVHQIQGMADTVVQGDFMEWSDETYTSFDRIAMNPPFTNKQDIDHVIKAWSLLGSNGKLVAVMSGSITFANDKKTQAFRDLIDQHGWMEELPEDTFKESGTGVRTVLVFLEKGEEPETIEISDSTALSTEFFDCEEMESKAIDLARQYAKSKQIMMDCFKTLDEQSRILRDAFKEVKPTSTDWHISDFEIYRTFNAYNSHRQSDDELFKAMKIRGWRILIDALGVKQIMSIKKRKQFEEQLNSGDLPEIDEQTIMAILRSLVDQAQEFAVEASKEVFELLRPAGKWDGGQYKTNDAFRVGKKVILTHMTDPWYGGRRIHYGKEQHITAIDGVFHLLDGKGVLKEHPGPLAKAIRESKDGKGETDYFKFKCCKNGNLHLEFKNLELVKELNMQAVGERVLGKGK